MLKEKNHCRGHSLKCTALIFAAVFLIFCMQFYEVTTNGGVLVAFVETEFTCKDGTRIRGRKICDRIADCSHAEDEIGCNYVCKPGEKRCNMRGFCIESGKLCDGRKDCPKGEDEVGCYSHNTVYGRSETPHDTSAQAALQKGLNAVFQL